MNLILVLFSSGGFLLAAFHKGTTQRVHPDVWEEEGLGLWRTVLLENAVDSGVLYRAFYQDRKG